MLPFLLFEAGENLIVSNGGNSRGYTNLSIWSDSMSEQQLKAFLEQLKVDAGMQEKLKNAGPNAVVNIAESLGLAISTDCLTAVQEEVSEEELESVGGGTILPMMVASVFLGVDWSKAGL